MFFLNRKKRKIRIFEHRSRLVSRCCSLYLISASARVYIPLAFSFSTNQSQKQFLDSVGEGDGTGGARLPGEWGRG